jgi:hypothetical protein
VFVNDFRGLQRCMWCSLVSSGPSGKFCGSRYRCCCRKQGSVASPRTLEQGRPCLVLGACYSLSWIGKATCGINVWLMFGLSCFLVWAHLA